MFFAELSLLLADFSLVHPWFFASETPHHIFMTIPTLHSCVRLWGWGRLVEEISSRKVLGIKCSRHHILFQQKSSPRYLGNLKERYPWRLRTTLILSGTCHHQTGGKFPPSFHEALVKPSFKVSWPTPYSNHPRFFLGSSHNIFIISVYISKTCPQKNDGIWKHDFLKSSWSHPNLKDDTIMPSFFPRSQTRL